MSNWLESRGALTLGQRIGMLIVLALAAILPRLYWLTSDFPALVAGVLPDDAFYYFEIAGRVWQGEGVTFDGMNSATGFHPLWLLAILPFFAGGTAGAVLPVKLVLFLQTCIHFLTALQLTRLNLRITKNALASTLLGVGFLVNVWSVHESINGLETALALFLAVTALQGILECQSGRARGDRSRWNDVRLGAVLSLCYLARSDMALLLFVPCLILLRGIREHWQGTSIIAGLPATTIMAASLSNMVLTGQALQSSAMAVPHVMHANFAHGVDNLSYGQIGAMCLYGFRQTWRQVWSYAGPIAPAALIGSTLACLVIMIGAGEKGTLHRRAFCVVLLFVGGIMALHGVHGAIRWYPRTWYFVYWLVPLYVVPGLLMTMTLERIKEGKPRVERLCIVLIAVVVLTEIQHTARWSTHPLFSWQAEAMQGVEAFDSHLPAGEPLGSFNAGLIGYMIDRPVVNLDGVVNEGAHRAIRDSNLAAYLRSEGIEYVLDYPAMWTPKANWVSVGYYFNSEHTPIEPDVVGQFDLPNVGWPSVADALQLIRLR